MPEQPSVSERNGEIRPSLRRRNRLSFFLLRARLSMFMKWPKVLLIACGLGVLLLIGQDITGHESQPGVQHARIGQEVRDKDGNLAFTVTTVKGGIKEIGLRHPVRGQFVEVEIKARNVSTEPNELIIPLSQRLYVGKKAYAAIDEADAFFADSRGLDVPMNPGEQVSGALIFDIPVGGQPTSIALRDFGQVIVKLR